MKDELTAFMEKQRPITEATKQFQQSSKDGNLSRPVRRKVNGLGEEEQSLAGKIEFLVTALTEEGNLVYRSVLSANLEDLREVHVPFFEKRFAAFSLRPGDLITCTRLAGVNTSAKRTQRRTHRLRAVQCADARLLDDHPPFVLCRAHLQARAR